MESAGWPIPHISAILRRIATHRPKCFATMDSTQGFYQMEVELEWREMLCFTTYLGNFVWNRAPMGPKSVPSAFQRAMEVEVFPDLLHKIMEVYIDDFIVWAEDELELISRLESVFTRARECNLKLNPKKCKFGMTEVEYCDHVITAEGVTFSLDRINEVTNFEVPKTQGSLKSFLGMAGYMREHVPHYGDLVHPLQVIVAHYTKKKKLQPIDWTPELLQAFQQFKDAIGSIQTLYHRDENADLRLYTDASKYGIGAYLCQTVMDSETKLVEQPLGFISKSLTETERRWSVYEKEAYAIFYACKKWEHFLRGHHFYLFTDHKNLTFLNRPPSEKVMRWRLNIQEYDFSVAYIKGAENNVADAMSRCLPNAEPDNDSTYTHRHTVLQYLNGTVPMWDILPEVPEALYGLLENKIIPQFVVDKSEINMFSSIIAEGPVSVEQLKSTDTTANSTGLYSLMTTLLAPQQATHRVEEHPLAAHEKSTLTTELVEILNKVHCAEVGHGGTDRTLELIAQLQIKQPELTDVISNWTSKRADVKRFIKHCPICQKVKKHQLLKYTPLYTQSTYGLMDNLSIDTVYMPESTNGNKYLLVVIDSFSRYLGVFPLKELSAETAANCLIQWMSDFGIPSHICCDNGSQFLGHFTKLLQLLTIHGYTIHAYSHEENSIVERANKEILTVLRCLVLEKRLRDNWDVLCHVAKRIINSRIHSAIGVAPADLIFGGRVDLQRGSLFPHVIPEDQNTPEYLMRMQEAQMEMLHKAMQMQNARNAKRMKSNDTISKTIFPVSSYVLVKPEVAPTNKLAPQWLGPYLILKRFERREGDVYRCLHLSTNREFDFRVDRINPFFFDDDAALHETAELDNEQYEVESVLRHKFIGLQTAKNLQLEIKWIGYDTPQWQKFNQGGLNEVDIVHEYLRRYQLTKLIPQKFR